MEDLLHGGLSQLEADEHDHHRHRKAGKIFKPGVAVGMVLVRGLLGKPEAQQGHDGAGRVGQVIHGIGGDGHGARQQAHCQLSGKQQQIADDAHDSGQAANGSATPGGVRWVFYKELQQEFGDNNPS